MPIKLTDEEISSRVRIMQTPGTVREKAAANGKSMLEMARLVAWWRLHLDEYAAVTVTKETDNA